MFERKAARVAALAACAASFFLPLACQDARPASNPAPAIVLDSGPGSATFGAVDVVNLDPATLRALNRAALSLEQWHEVLAVRTAAVADSSPLPLLGRYSVERDRVRFTPRFAPAPGQVYRVHFDGAAVQRVTNSSAPAAVTALDTTWQVAALSSAPSTTVVQVYPTSDRLPVNLLRVYIHFSAPMSMGEAYQRVHLLNDQGEMVPDAFLVIAGEKELWDPQRQRLTLLFDPGRIKQNLRPNLEVGLPLREGHNFTLVIDSVWQDARGRPLIRPFRKHFTVVAADRTSPRTEDWRLTAPAAGGRGPVVLRFPESLDQALLERVFIVTRADGSVLPGAVAVTENETSWSFVPAAAWTAGEYFIQIGTELEDLAGNNLRELFDVDRKSSPARGTNVQLTELGFTVR